MLNGGNFRWRQEWRGSPEKEDENQEKSLKTPEEFSNIRTQSKINKELHGLIKIQVQRQDCDRNWGSVCALGEDER